MSRFGVGCRTPLGGSYRSPLGALACPGGCPAAIELTLSGVDAAICACQRSGTTGSFLFSDSSVDGTYELTYAGTDGIGCKYELANAVDLSGDLHAGTVCGGGGTPTTIPQRFNVWLSDTGSQIVSIDCRTMNTGSGVHAKTFIAESIAVAFGASVGNDLDCNPPSTAFGYQPHYSSGGTATVVKA